MPFSSLARQLNADASTTSDGPASASPPDRRFSSPARPPRRGRPRVLFVDDELSLVHVAIRALPYSGCDAFGFADPAAALAELRANPHSYDALVTDLAMPRMTGLELAAKARELRPDLPVVLTSGQLTVESRRAADAARIDRIVPKPCSMDQLAQAVVDILGARRAVQAAA